MRKEKEMKKILSVFLSISVLLICFSFAGCRTDKGGTEQDTAKTIAVADRLQRNQPTPTDVDYSLERYNLIRRTYWVNGMREKANALPCPVERPLGYVVLFSGSVVVGSFIVDGKVSSLNSFLTPDSEYYECNSSNHLYNLWLADVDGSYGENDTGIFFFTTDGKYVEWNGGYLYSDIPFTVESPVLTVGEK